jgi:arginine/lysine/ornithine decarboxylase
MLQSTSASYILMASLDVARRNLVIEGNKIFNELIELTSEAKLRINSIDGFNAIDESYLNGDSRNKLDQMKIMIQVNELGFSGFEIYDMLAAEYGIQMELAEAHVTLAIISVGDTKESIDKLVNALSDISKRFYGKKQRMEVKSLLIHNPVLKVSPRQAFYGHAHDMNINDAVGQISANSIMIYPPGIPLLIPGEVISEEIIDHYHYYVAQGGVILNDDGQETIKILEV